jgi:hypothetical protein
MEIKFEYAFSAKAWRCWGRPDGFHCHHFSFPIYTITWRVGHKYFSIFFKYTFYEPLMFVWKGKVLSKEIMRAWSWQVLPFLCLFICIYTLPVLSSPVLGRFSIEYMSRGVTDLVKLALIWGKLLNNFSPTVLKHIKAYIKARTLTEDHKKIINSQKTGNRTQTERRTMCSNKIVP